MRKYTVLLLLLSVFLVSACGNSERTDDNPQLESGASSSNNNEDASSNDDDTADNLIDRDSLAILTVDNIANLEELRKITVSGNQQVFNFVISPNEEVIVAQTQTTTQVYDFQTLELISIINTGNENNWNVAIHPDGERLVTVGDTNGMQEWDVRTGETIDFLPTPPNAATAVAFTQTGDKALVGTVGGFTYLVDVESGETEFEVSWQRGFQFVSYIDISSDGSMFLTAHPYGTFILWDIETGERLNRFIDHNNDVLSANFSPDDSLIVSTGADDRAFVYETETFEQLHLIGHQFDTYNGLIWPDNSLVVITGQEALIRFFNHATDEIAHEIQLDSDIGKIWTRDLYLSEDQKLFVYAYNGQIVINGVAN